MRNMSFMLTTEQIRNHTKTVTRRLGWGCLKPGDKIQAVEKCMGLKKSEKMNKLAVLEVVSVQREKLWSMQSSPRYGQDEAVKEGFPDLGGDGFVKMFCEHMGCTPETDVTRIEFKYLE